MAYLFDEVNDSVASGPAASELLSLSSSTWTISLWVKLTDNTGTQSQYILSKNLPGNNPSLNWYIVEASNAATSTRNELGFQISDTDTTDSGETVSIGQPFLSNTSWTHIVLTRNSTTLTQYINGSADGSITVAGLGQANSNNTTYFGQRSDSDADRFFGGSMAEFGHWDRVLSSAEITALSRGFSPNFFLNGLVRYMPMIREYVDVQSNVNFVNTGTTVTSHPPIIYPSRATMGRHVPDMSQTISVTGLTTESALGSPSLGLNVTLTGLSSVEALGSPSLTTDDTVNLTGLPSTESIGTVVVSRENTIDLSGLASVSALGTPVIANTQIIVLTGLSSTEALGTPQVSNLQTISFDGLSSQSSIGSLEVANVQYIVLEGLSTESVFGTPVLIDLGFSRVTPTTGDFTYVPF